MQRIHCRNRASLHQAPIPCRPDIEQSTPGSPCLHESRAPCCPPGCRCSSGRRTRSARRYVPSYGNGISGGSISRIDEAPEHALSIAELGGGLTDPLLDSCPKSVVKTRVVTWPRRIVEHRPFAVTFGCRFVHFRVFPPQRGWLSRGDVPRTPVAGAMRAAFRRRTYVLWTCACVLMRVAISAPFSRSLDVFDSHAPMVHIEQHVEF